MRGKATFCSRFRTLCRITPAYAGKRGTTGRGSSHRGDHPRVCGEKKLHGISKSSPIGSPPRMRGKAQTGFALGCRVGITPAYAGKSTWRGRTALFAGDHPRVCGEKGLTFHQMLRPTGSPPRMRGKATINDLREAIAGITPAYAGKRTCKTQSLAATWDHPRVCGEKTKKIP